MTSKKCIVIGAGFAGISAASSLAQKGYDVTILEKNSIAGGRARKFEQDGFMFDMGPSWYWMPEVFDNYFENFGKKTSDYYKLTRISPSYQITFGKDHHMQVPSDMSDLEALFETYEEGSSIKLREFLKEASYKYKVGMTDFVFRPGKSILEFADTKVLSNMFKIDLFTSISKHIRSLFSNPFLIQLLEFPVLFLGATPENTPALYSLMNYADLSLGTWYPMGGMHKIIEGMTQLAIELGVKIKLEANVNHIVVEDKKVTGVSTNNGFYPCDVLVGAADYHHIEQSLLPKDYRQYDEKYWDNRVMAPSSLIFYLGINKKIKGLHHHNLFFDADFKKHAIEIYNDPKWPTNPLFYTCAPSVTDASVAPKDCENLFILIPVAPGLTKDDDSLRDSYYHLVMNRLEEHLGQEIKKYVIFKRSYAHSNFIEDYNAFKGNAYGLANTLMQTAFLKPKLKNPKLKNMYYTGQLTTPGPGVPPSLISGRVVADQIHNDIK